MKPIKIKRNNPYYDYLLLAICVILMCAGFYISSNYSVHISRIKDVYILIFVGLGIISTIICWFSYANQPIRLVTLLSDGIYLHKGFLKRRPIILPYNQTKLDIIISLAITTRIPPHTFSIWEISLLFHYNKQTYIFKTKAPIRLRYQLLAIRSLFSRLSIEVTLPDLEGSYELEKAGKDYKQFLTDQFENYRNYGLYLLYPEQGEWYLITQKHLWLGMVLCWSITLFIVVLSIKFQSWVVALISIISAIAGKRFFNAYRTNVQTANKLNDLKSQELNEFKDA